MLLTALSLIFIFYYKLLYIYIFLKYNIKLNNVIINNSAYFLFLI